MHIMRSLFSLNPSWDLFFDSREFEWVRSQYEPRPYHNLTHVREVCAHINQNSAHFSNVDDAMLAAVYHDVCKTERESASEMRDEAGRFFGDEMTGRAALLILANRKQCAGDAALFIDCDYAILGAEVERYEDYRTAIRREYIDVPEWLYRKERAKFLVGLMREDSVFKTEVFRNALEERAFNNIQRELHTLGVIL